MTISLSSASAACALILRRNAIAESGNSANNGARARRHVVRLRNSGGYKRYLRTGRNQLARGARRRRAGLGGFSQRIPFRGNHPQDRPRLGPGRSGGLAPDVSPLPLATQAPRPENG